MCEKEGIPPFDESVFGVRDMVGSVKEFTSGIPTSSFSMASLRGGSFESIDAPDYRISTRTVSLPWV